MARYFNNIAAAKADYLAKNPDLAYLKTTNVAVSSLPAEYDDTPYRTVINGTYTKTVGEYKAICQRFETYY
jgi:hypothetical protein